MPGKAKSEYTLNERDSLVDLLNSEKQLVKLYGTALTEASTKQLRSLLRTQFAEAAEDQFSVFEQMQQHDYYAPKPADKAIVDQKKDDFGSALPRMKK